MPATAQIYNYPMFLPADVFKPEVVAERYKRHGDQFLPLYMLLRSMMREKRIAADTWFGHEDTDIHTTFHSLNGFVASGPGVTQTITLTAADVDATGHSYPRGGDEVLMPNLNIGWIVPGSKVVLPAPAYTTTFTLAPKGGSSGLGTLAAGQELSIVSGSRANGTGPVDPAARDIRKKTFSTQLVKEHIAIEGGVLADQVWSKVYADDGKTIIGVYSDAMNDMQYRMDLKINGGCWIGQENLAGAGQLTETGYAGYANPVWGTNGLIRGAQAEGLNYPAGGTWSLTNFDDLTTYLVQQRVPTGYVMFMQGVTLGNNINNVLYQANLNTQVNYTQAAETLFGGGDRGKKLAMNIDFKQYGHNTGFNFLFRAMYDWSNPETFGVSAYGFPQRGLCMPLTKITDPKTGAKLNNVEYVYKGMGAYSRRFILQRVSGAGEDMTVTQTLNDWSDTACMATFGIQQFADNQFINIY